MLFATLLQYQLPAIVIMFQNDLKVFQNLNKFQNDVLVFSKTGRLLYSSNNVQRETHLNPDALVYELCKSDLVGDQFYYWNDSKLQYVDKQFGIAARSLGLAESVHLYGKNRQEIRECRY